MSAKKLQVWWTESYMLVSWLDIEQEPCIHQTSEWKAFHSPSADEPVNKMAIDTMEDHLATNGNDAHYHMMVLGNFTPSEEASYETPQIVWFIYMKCLK